MSLGKVTFDKDVKFGERAEIRVKDLLEDCLSTRYVIDCRKDKLFQELDIDYIQVKMDGTLIKYEVKNDRSCDDTGNMFYEKYSNSNIGCMERTKADYIIYFSKNKAYIFEPQKLRDYIRKINPNLISAGDNAKGYLINVDELKKERIINEVTSQFEDYWEFYSDAD